MSKTRYPRNLPPNKVGAFSSPFALSASYLKIFVPKHLKSEQINLRVESMFNDGSLESHEDQNYMFVRLTESQVSKMSPSFLFYSSFALHSHILSNATNSHKLPEITLSTKFLPFRSCTRLLNSPSSFHSPNSYIHPIQFTPNLMSQVILLSFDFWSLEWSGIQFMLFCNIVLI